MAGWADLVRDGHTAWDGVRNHAAAAHLRAMVPGDRILIYHSGAEKAVVGIAEVTEYPRPDGDDGGWVAVTIRAIDALARPVTLAAMKATPALSTLPMLRQSRLSVSPVDTDQWDAIIALSGGHNS
jgi:predicted RNA-binding protein with PUA-like domain